MFRPLLLGALSSVPVIGGYLASNTDLLLVRALAWATVSIQGAIGPFAELMDRIRWSTVLVAAAGSDAVDAGWAALWRVRYQAMPALEARVEGYAQSLYQLAIVYAETLAAQLAIYVEHLVAGAIAYAEQLALLGQQYAQQLAVKQQQYTAAAVATAERYAEQLAQSSQQYAQTLTMDAERYAGQLAREDQDYARALQRQALDHADQVGLQAEDYARQLAQDVLGAVGGAAAAALAATGAVAARVTDLEDSPCQRFCSPLGDLGSILQQLEGAGLLALVLALITEAEQHPDAVAQDIKAVVGPLAQDAVKALQLGIPA